MAVFNKRKAHKHKGLIMAQVLLEHVTKVYDGGVVAVKDASINLPTRSLWLL